MPFVNWSRYYDLKTDPSELVNAYGSLANEVKEQMGRELAALQQCSGAACHRTSERQGTKGQASAAAQ